MATSYVLNMFGKYEENEKGEKGITLHYCGIPFWFGYQKVTVIPNWTFKELDHEKSTPQSGQTAVLTYQNTIIPGHIIVRDLIENGVPISPKDMGIMPIDGRPTGKSITVKAGCSADDAILTAEVIEREPTKAEMERAETAADNFRRSVIANYFQSKRERMANGKGRITPIGMERVFMEELGVEDIDDVTTHQKSAGGIDPQLVALIVEAARSASEVNKATLMEALESIRRGEKLQIAKAKGINNVQTVAPLTEEEIQKRKDFGQRMKDIRAKKAEARAAAETKEKETVGA